MNLKEKTTLKAMSLFSTTATESAPSFQIGQFLDREL